MSKTYRLGGKTFANVTFNTTLKNSIDVKSIRDVKNILREINVIRTEESWNQVGTTLTGKANNDKTGASVSLSSDGTVLAIGSPQQTTGSNGYASVYKSCCNIWIKLGSDIIGEASDDESGFYLSISGDGSTLAVGAPRNDVSGSDHGHVRIHKWDGTAWNQLGTDIDGEAAGDRFGYNLSLSKDGNTVIIGSYLNDAGGDQKGHARVLRWDGSDWTQLGADLDGDDDKDWFGRSVYISADGNKVVIGASLGGRSPGNYGLGYAKVYEWNGSAWVQVGTTLTGIAEKDWFGFSAAMSTDGNTVALGAPFYDTNRGYTAVYRFNGSEWVQLGTNILGESQGEISAYSINLSADGTIVAIGSVATTNGQVRVFEWNGTTWNQIGLDIDGGSSGDRAGESVSLSANGTLLAIGANGADSSSGNVKLYELN